mmetsp:Transcript_51446/g.143851  ORF Transcript_51446/g.143851 Transcript_51446/m.143851 type:complete len:92 (+) Transcript_51446:736-1011(+)
MRDLGGAACATPQPVWMRTSQGGGLDATGQKKHLWHTSIAPWMDLMSSFWSRTSGEEGQGPGRGAKEHAVVVAYGYARACACATRFVAFAS